MCPTLVALPKKYIRYRKQTLGLGRSFLLTSSHLLLLTLNQISCYLLYQIVLLNMMKYQRAFCASTAKKHFTNDSMLHCYIISKILFLCRLKCFLETAMLLAVSKTQNLSTKVLSHSFHTDLKVNNFSSSFDYYSETQLLSGTKVVKKCG
jgi:hypothetical protein